ncbi:MAG: hypothetical protein WA821_15435 [Anaerolineales bacterium]
MKPIIISLVTVGNLKYPLNFDDLKKWPSALFKIEHGASIGQIPNAQGTDNDEWEYPKEQLRKIIHREPSGDITFALINAPLEGNYFMRRLGDNIVVLSLYEMAEIIRDANFTIENYIIRNVYEIIVLFLGNQRTVPDSSSTWTHDEIRGCLFDMNANKSDIIFSMHNPTLCTQCRNRLLSAQIDSNVIPSLTHELKKLKKEFFFRMIEYVRAHPIWSLVITAATALVLNLLASVIYDLVKYLIMTSSK